MSEKVRTHLKDHCNPYLRKKKGFFQVRCNCNISGHMSYQRSGAIKLWNSDRMNPDLTNKKVKLTIEKTGE